MKTDAVLTYHSNPYGCGVAKFNILLAQRLNVSIAPLTSATKFKAPMVSVKGAELPSDRTYAMPSVYDLFLHDAIVGAELLTKARKVYAADQLIAQTLKARRPDIETAWCPSMLVAVPPAACNVLTFGMAHKAQPSRLLKLKALLDGTSQPYTVSVSLAIHEGTPFADGWQQAEKVFRDIFGPHLRVLGFLGDDALAEELKYCTAAALFFDPAARANNTSLWAALESGATVITNLDVDSPAELRGMVYDIDGLNTWPQFRRELSSRSWDALIGVLRA